MAEPSKDPRVNSLQAMSDGLLWLERSISMYLLRYSHKGLSDLPEVRAHLDKARRVIDLARHRTGLP